MRALCLCVLLAAVPAIVRAQTDEPLLRSPRAQAFGSAPSMVMPRLSPDGRKISYIQRNEQGRTFLGVFDLDTGDARTVLAGEEERFQIDWCGWANETRLLCGFRAIFEYRDRLYVGTRLVAVNADGSDALPLLQRRTERDQDDLLDWLRDDPEHVLIRAPVGFGSGTGRLNIYDGGLNEVGTVQPNTVAWLTDGRGNLRLFVTSNNSRYEWHIRASLDSEWTLVHEASVDDDENRFLPIGFAADDQLAFMRTLDGRMALYEMDLRRDHATQLIFSHPAVDVGAYTLGKYERVVGAVYVDDRPRFHFFDPRIREVHDLVSKELADKTVYIVDEDWNQRNYLLVASSAEDAGRYLHFDAERRILTSLSPVFPALDGVRLAPMLTVEIRARDGVSIPGYLTLPDSAEPVPAVVLPHGGPASRDYYEYDLLAQFLAANGYAVLQVNYRGSAGYGDEWLGEGYFHGWRQAVDDVVDSVAFVSGEGRIDASRMCAVGGSYGGYLALLVAMELQTVDCVVSIAGVTDLEALARIYSERYEERLGLSGETLEAGSPIERARELRSPVLLFHGERDMNVPYNQSREMERALRRADVPVQMISYPDAEHSISRASYRIDLLTRIAAFLGEHIGPESTIAE